MRWFLRLVVWFAPMVLASVAAAEAPADLLGRLPAEPAPAIATDDYLLHRGDYHAALYRSPRGELVLANGLVRRVWQLEPGTACVALDNLMTGQGLLRSVRPEARVTLAGATLDVGGLVGQKNHAYLSPDQLAAMQPDPAAMRLVAIETGVPRERFGWQRRRHASPSAVWPPPGVYVRFDYEPATAKPAVRVAVHYELYDGVPVFSKWVTVQNRGDAPLLLDRYRGEELAVVEQSSWIEIRDEVPMPPPESLHVETDHAFGGFDAVVANMHAVKWVPDPLYTTQVNYLLQTPCLLVAEPDVGPAQTIPPRGEFVGFRTFELLYDGSDHERRGLAYCCMMRTIAPWVTENPLTHHLLSNRPEEVRAAIDHAAEVGFEAIILSFGSGFNMENRDPKFLAEWREVADYAESKGIELGCYSLFSSRGVGAEHMIVSPPGITATHGQCPAVTSAWGQQWLATIRDFYVQTGFDQFENDGPYPGDIDTTPRPPFQQGELDSRWVQWRMTSQLYRDLRAAGVFINAPDYYYLSGSNKCGMGYREVNWSLPRAEQVIHTRQNIFDGTWTKTPSMGWMFVPLSQYHGGGAAATIEPLHEHRDHYRRMLESNLGMGVQAHYRGPRLFDTPETQTTLRQAVDWFHHYRDILESDVVHGRRADGRDLDWVLHANPQLETKGLLCVYNPLAAEVTRTLQVNLYYTGLTTTARISRGDAEPVAYPLDRAYRVPLEVTVPAGGMVWYAVR